MENPERNVLQRFTDPLVYGALLGVESAVRLAGPAAGYGLASTLGSVWYHTFGGRRRVIRRNLEVAFQGRLDAREQDRIGVACCRHALASAIDVMVRTSRVRPETWERFVSFDPLLEEELSREHPRGLAILSGHVGSWEMGQYFCGLLGRPVSPVVRSLDNPYLDRHSRARRLAFGGVLIRKTGALRGIRTELQRGGRVGIIADQNCPLAESFYPFFGVLASTYAQYAKLLVRQRCRVIFTACLRDGFRFRFRFRTRELTIPSSGSLEERAGGLIRSYLAAIEDVARAHPEQYLWMHRRWKKRPAGEPPFYARARAP